jgi:alpha-tubulin suppressor-like RCC1 family protein
MKKNSRLFITMLVITGLVLILTYGCEKEKEPVITGISAGYGHSFVVKSDGTLLGWGYNTAGQLGDGTSEDQHSPVQIGTDYLTISAGGYHTLAIKSDGTLWAWGRNMDGEVGDGTLENRNTPVQVGTGFKRISAGVAYNLALTSDYSLYACTIRLRV